MSTLILNGAIIHMADCYRYKGVTFEWHAFCGPMLLRKDKEPSQRRPGPKFYALATEWHQLPPKEREQFRV